MNAISHQRAPKIRCLLMILTFLGGICSGQSADEYEVKAAFIYSFTKFIEWPSIADSSSFAICILGDDPFQTDIDELTSGKLVGPHPLKIRRLKDGADGKQCQIVFVGASERAKASKLVDSVRGLSVLTVGESAEFLRMGGMVFLSMEDNHVSVVINPAATEAARLKVSAKLMTLAKVYKR